MNGADKTLKRFQKRLSVWYQINHTCKVFGSCWKRELTFKTQWRLFFANLMTVTHQNKPLYIAFAPFFKLQGTVKPDFHFFPNLSVVHQPSHQPNEVYQFLKRKWTGKLKSSWSKLIFTYFVAKDRKSLQLHPIIFDVFVKLNLTSSPASSTLRAVLWLIS